MQASFRALLLPIIVFLAGTRVAVAEAPSVGTPVDGAPSTEKTRPPHPEPRVIVNVSSVRGPHKPADVQRSARFGWSRIVRCYKSNAPRERVLVALELVVAGEGKVASARHVHTNTKHRALATCLAGTLQGLAMPKAQANSTANVEIQLAPGDPPPKS